MALILEAMKKDDEQYSDKEAERRAREATERSFQMTHKPHKQVAADTAAAKAQAKRRAKDRPPKS